MNNNYNNRNNQRNYTSNRNGYDRSQSQQRSSWNPKATKRAELERERLNLERQIERVRAKAMGVGQKVMLVQHAQATHQQKMPLAIAQAGLSMLGVRFLPPVARQWAYTNDRYQQQLQWLQAQAIDCVNEMYGLEQEIALIDTELNLLQFS